MRARRMSAMLAVPVLAVLTLALIGCDDEDTRPVSAEVPHVTVVARDYGYEMPAEIPAGTVQMTLRNEGPEPHHAQLARLKDGVTLERFNEEIRRGPEAALPLLNFPGGPSVIGPGDAQDVTLSLTAGQYVMLCFVESPDGVPHLAKGMIQPFRVTERAGAADSPSSTGEATLRDFGFTLNNVTSANATVKVTNAGPQVHETVVVKPVDGKTLADVRDYLQEPQGPPPFAPAGGMQALDPGGSGWLTLDLAPGTYVFLCNVPDRACGKPHAELGMIQSVTLQ